MHRLWLLRLKRADGVTSCSSELRRACEATSCCCVRMLSSSFSRRSAALDADAIGGAPARPYYESASEHYEKNICSGRGVKLADTYIKGVLRRVPSLHATVPPTTVDRRKFASPIDFSALCDGVRRLLALCCKPDRPLGHVG